jgi:hypothetical protein
MKLPLTECCSQSGFEIYKAASKKMAVFWVVVPCSVAASIIRAITLMMEAARTSETLVNFYQTARRYNPEDNHLCPQSVFGLQFKNLKNKVLLKNIKESVLTCKMNILIYLQFN